MTNETGYSGILKPDDILFYKDYIATKLKKLKDILISHFKAIFFYLIIIFYCFILKFNV